MTTGTGAEVSNAPLHSVYRALPGWWRGLVWTNSAAFTVVAVLLVTQRIVGSPSGPPWGFVVFWLCAYLWVVPQFLLRFAFELELEEGVVRWKAALRSGHFHVNDLRSVRPYRWGRNAEVVELRSGQKLFVMTRRGFREFAGDLRTSAPFATIEFSQGLMKLAERWPGNSSGYERRG